MSFPAVSAVSLATVIVLFGATFAVGRRIGRYNIVDVAWGPGFVAVAAVAAAVGHGDLARRLLVLILVAVWGLRLAWHIHAKTAGKGEDPRYRELLGDNPSASDVLRRVFAIQAASLWFVSLPVQLSATTGPTPATVLFRASATGRSRWQAAATMDAELTCRKSGRAGLGGVV